MNILKTGIALLLIVTDLRLLSPLLVDDLEGHSNNGPGGGLRCGTALLAGYLSDLRMHQEYTMATVDSGERTINPEETTSIMTMTCQYDPRQGPDAHAHFF